jgi:cytoskeletal protein CcmA (bactofilin family)
MGIGASIVIKGDITGGEDLLVLGRVEGSIRLHAGALSLAAGSHVVGDVMVPAVVVQGHVEGNINATERVEVRATAVIQGTVATPAIVFAEGAQMTGRVEMPAVSHPQSLRPAEGLPVAV